MNPYERASITDESTWGNHQGQQAREDEQEKHGFNSRI